MTNGEPTSAISESLDLLSDTVYREQASEQLDRFLVNREKLPVEKTQIYGLRQIARQQPGQIGRFADHQRERAERKLKMKNGDGRLEAEIAFWKLVTSLCRDSTTEWSVIAEGVSRLPDDLREESMPEKRQGMSAAERQHRNAFKQRRKRWLDQWREVHVPAFFERFCTHTLYRSQHSGKAGRESREDLA